MRINPPGSNQVQGSELSRSRQAEQARGKEQAGKAEATSAKSTIPDSVRTDISGRATETAQAKAAATDAPDVREDKIAALKARIESGTYRIDADRIADRMIDEHKALGAAGIG
jgi:negative regulator of flagellin synthesis FlgM